MDNKEILDNVNNDVNTILGFDTCLDKMYVSLKKDGQFLASQVVENTDTKYHSAFLISTIQEVLSSNGVKPPDIDLIAINIGPGSFTGIRACTTVARVMAQQLNTKTAGVSSLEILAKIYNGNTFINASEKEIKALNRHAVLTPVSNTNGNMNPLVALDARKDSAYLYYDGEIKGAVKLDEIKEIIKTGKYFVITDNKLQPILGGISYQQGNYPLGKFLVNLAEERVNSTDCDWRKLKPLYIQPPPMG